MLGAASHQYGSGFFGRFLFFLPEGDFYSSGQSAIRMRQVSLRLHYDLFGSLKRNEHAQSTDRGSLRPRPSSEGAPFQSFQSGQGYLIGKILLGFHFEVIAWNKAQFFGLHTAGGDAPQVHRETTGQRHDGFLAGRG